MRFSDFKYAGKRKQIRRERFLAEMDRCTRGASRKTEAISPLLSGAPPELSEGFDTIWPVSGRKNREIFQIRPGSPVVFRMRQSFHRF